MIGDLLESDVCPKPMISDQSFAMIRLYGHYQNGYLPRAGGILDQPAKFLSAMEIIGSVVNAKKS